MFICAGCLALDENQNFPVTNTWAEQSGRPNLPQVTNCTTPPLSKRIRNYWRTRSVENFFPFLINTSLMTSVNG